MKTLECSESLLDLNSYFRAQELHLLLFILIPIRIILLMGMNWDCTWLRQLKHVDCSVLEKKEKKILLFSQDCYWFLGILKVTGGIM